VTKTQFTPKISIAKAAGIASVIIGIFEEEDFSWSDGLLILGMLVHNVGAATRKDFPKLDVRAELLTVLGDVYDQADATFRTDKKPS
jgi:hypothetical protein